MILIIGYGNPLRGDDALGQVAVTRLAQRFAGDPDVHVRAVQQLTPELAEEFAAYGTVVLIDARHRAPAGQVFVEQVPATADPGPRIFSHHATPSELLLLARELYGAEPRLYLAGITATVFDVGAPLSPPVEAALPALLEQVHALVGAAGASPAR